MDDEAEYQFLFPIQVLIEEGKEYCWCSCRKSNSQPFCDKQDCGVKAILFKAELTEDAFLCNCKRTKNPPWCDGSHAKALMEIAKARQKANK
ncbi:CDGSH iron-sulfur domain-containing protein [Legionella waltersii]|uniref:Glutamate synthetase n=1 Tax=Legionella waltersii TaxID=66969 RepID=A0A0W1A0P6_9GAMM|nr:CDGSH iron-sulfur domain-containing protein [Legionella waltersii]KTD74809.1 glutamate synthetase [Legionella waltersii]SNV00885.1 glutamate synthetase [Legionella waltersii]